MIELKLCAQLGDHSRQKCSNRCTVAMAIPRYLISFLVLTFTTQIKVTTDISMGGQSIVNTGKSTLHLKLLLPL